MRPLKLCGRNPHYVEIDGEPSVLVTSGEHYGAVLNLDFDYVPYLDELKRNGFNLTRTFSGTYREIPGSFKIENNTLAPAPGRFVCPWRREGNAGGDAYDLTKWDDAYFARLRDFVACADERGIVVEFVLFCFHYNDGLWAASPLNARNNTQGVGDVGRFEAYGAARTPLLDAQESFVTKVVTELGGHHNVYFEIMNEPYSKHDGTAFDEWQRRIADVIVEADAGRGHLVARNYQNKTMRVDGPLGGVSIANFHYAEPSAVGDNYHLGIPVIDDETGFKGQGAAPYRKEAWRFMVSGGGGVSHLDYSFTTASPDGSAPVTGETPGFGGRAWRAQLSALKRFLEGFDLASMRPHNEVLQRVSCDGPSAQCLADVGKAYAVYVECGGAEVQLNVGLPPGAYDAEWVDPATGEGLGGERIDHDGTGWGCRLSCPAAVDDVALRIDALA